MLEGKAIPVSLMDPSDSCQIFLGVGILVLIVDLGRGCCLFFVFSCNFEFFLKLIQGLRWGEEYWLKQRKMEWPVMNPQPATDILTLGK